MNILTARLVKVHQNNQNPTIKMKKAKKYQCAKLRKQVLTTKNIYEGVNPQVVKAS
jgi:hypothetical protein